MPAAALLRALLAGVFIARLLAGADEQSRRFAPTYAASTVVHAASQQSGTFAPNTIVTLYGRELAYVSRPVQDSDIRDGLLPTVLPGTGVRVLVEGQPAPLYYVSPTQVNLLLPASLKPGLRRMQLALDGRAGPSIEIQVGAAAPGLFLAQPGWALAVRLDGSLVTYERPATPGDVLILFATGLGAVTGPLPRIGEVARQAAPLVAAAEFAVLLNGEPIAAEHVFYAGLAPGFAGLYQINLRVPPGTPANPEIRLRAGTEVVMSADGVRLAVGAQ
ncbi:MAG: hypothetical protein IT162_08775 [Bryobacterales bacterium]|nr:hypothetical protein [Bryobacterales bacterium]